MTARFERIVFADGLAERLKRPSRGASGFSLFWLGQAGFLLETGPCRILIDPYLSNSLERKYAGSATPHERMMPAPIAPDALDALDLVLCTHRHTDHMDPDTLRPLAERFATLRFVVPAAETAEAMRRAGVGEERLVPLEAGDTVEPLPGLRIHALRAAHETLETDERGRHRFLGLAVEGGGGVLFHSGDTVPFEGQVAEVAALKADLALFPVNGRSAALAALGVPGNMTVEEAVALARGAGIPNMIAHHYGLFAFNTADPDALDAALGAAGPGMCAGRARLGVEYRLDAAPAGAG